MSRSVFLVRMKNIAYESCRENRSTYFIFDNCFSGSRAVREIMWKNYVERDRPQMTLWQMRITYWISKATNAHSHCVILIAFPRQQWLHERASMLSYTYTDCVYRFFFICVFVCVVLVFCASHLIDTSAVEPAYE
jgi:hypothetical protein